MSANSDYLQGEIKIAESILKMLARDLYYVSDKFMKMPIEEIRSAVDSTIKDVEDSLRHVQNTKAAMQDVFEEIEKEAKEDE